MSAVLAAPSGLDRGLDAIHTMQLGTGEALAHAPETQGGGLRYVRCPLFSALVHDLLGCFDPRSAGWEAGALGHVDAVARGRLVRAAAHLRRRIRGYLVWQAEADGTWRLLGRASGLPADALSTAAAAAALLDCPGRAARERRARHVASIERLRSDDGLYHTALLPDGSGFGWWDAAGQTVAGYEPVVNAQVLRFLVLAGAHSEGDVAPLVRFLREQAAGRGEPGGLFTSRLVLAAFVARTWSQAGLPDLDGLAADLVPQVLALQDETGGFGGPLKTALAVGALLDLGYEGDELAPGLAAIAAGRQRWGGWGHDEVVAGGYSSPAWTTAASIAALARGRARLGGDA